MANYARAPVTFVAGQGCELIDVSGKRYLDFVAGIAVCALGHAHPAISSAIIEQAQTLVHCSNLYGHEPASILAQKLAQLSGFNRVFFCNSGTEANEAAIKLARKRAFCAGEQRRTILSCTGSFHGRTLGALAATANPHYHEGFEPLPAGFASTPFNDIAALHSNINHTTAAFVVEPIQGESGVHPASRAFLEAARQLCDEHGALLVFDEVQSGVGRTGKFFAFQHFGVRSDVVTLAKALANGLPIGAMLVDEPLAAVFQPGDHGSTFGGSPVPCAAALAHLRVRDELHLDDHVQAMGARLCAALQELHKAFPAIISEPRGLGLMLGVSVKAPHDATKLVSDAREKGLLINSAGGNSLRFTPPLVIDSASITRLHRVLGAIFEETATV
ncbi:MAG: aspartate aminotransferase family protein [Candidatus Eremiobacteraeota bacterium]|nr:aspartate aminotransferase family protein [Candidatus Eremiobacteraeota bacterium]